MPTSSNPSASETKAAIAIVLAIADTIRELGSVPSGHVYAHVMHRLSLGQYAAVIELLKKTGKVKEENHLLIWVTEKVCPESCDHSLCTWDRRPR